MWTYVLYMPYYVITQNALQARLENIVDQLISK